MSEKKAATKTKKKKNAGHGRILNLLRSNGRNLLYVFLAGTILIVPTAMTPVFKGVFVDNVLTDGLTEWLPILLGLMLTMSLVAGVLTWLQKNCLLKLANSIEISGAATYIWRLFHAPMSLFSKKDSYALLSQTGASKQISKVLTRDVINLLFAVVNVVFYLIMMLQVDRLMTVVVVGLILLSYAASKGKNALAKRFSPEADGPDAYELSLEADRISSAGLRNIETFKSTASEGIFFQRLIGSKQEIVNARRDDDYSDAYYPFQDLSELIFLNLLLLISALRIMNKSFTIGSYLTFEAYASMFFYPLNQVIDGKRVFDKSEKRLKNLYKTLESAEDREPPVGMPLGDKKLEGHLEFRDVSFSYEGGEPLLEGFNLCVKPGERVALVGKSGAGKSTIIKLAQGLYAPGGGTVTIDGASPVGMDPAVYVSSVGSANQHVTLFAASIRDNITMWDDTVTEADISKAANAARIHDYIASLEDGYNHELSERGGNLSGGQQQKLEIARAILYNPTLVFLDEATSSIDPDAREELEAELKRRGCACLVATHLLRDVMDYDEIIVLEQGKVVARGTHAELLACSEYYAYAFEAEKEVYA